MDYKRLYTNNNELEKEIELQCLQYLNSIGFFWKVDYAGQRIGSVMIKSSHPYIIAGMPDIQGIAFGQGFGFEIKIPSEYDKIMRNYDKYKAYDGKNKAIKRYKRQILNIEKMRDNGGIAYFVKSLDQVVRIINEFLQEKTSKK